MNKAENNRKNNLRMSINSLIGYVLVELFAVLAHVFGFSSITLGQILTLALLANISAILFYTGIYYKKEFGPGFERAIFAAQLAVFVAAFGGIVYYLNELRNAALVFALIAVVIELPFCSMAQLFVISSSSLVAYGLVSSYAILYGGQRGALPEVFFFGLSFVAPLLLIAYVARQFTRQKREIEEDKIILERLNSELVGQNELLLRNEQTTRQEMELAGFIQGALFPKEPPRVTGYDIAFAFKPVHDVSGDMYDFYLKNDQLKGVSLFDVSGHGIASGLITMLIKPILYRQFFQLEYERLEIIANQARKVIAKEIADTNKFVTGVMLRFKERTADYVNIGHPDIMVRRAAGGGASIISSTSDNDDFKAYPIGIHGGDQSIRGTSFPFEKGDMIFLFTDGILDGFNSQKRKYDQRDLLASLQHADPQWSAEEVLQFILKRFYGFVDPKGISDDFVVMIIKKTG